MKKKKKKKKTPFDLETALAGGSQPTEEDVIEKQGKAMSQHAYKYASELVPNPIQLPSREPPSHDAPTQSSLPESVSPERRVMTYKPGRYEESVGQNPERYCTRLANSRGNGLGIILANFPDCSMS